MKKLSGGFTLIELLIVIALLGALAIGLLATIDPFEQLKKGRDTSASNIVQEFLNASLRYYSTKGYLPWGTGATLTSIPLNTLGSSITTLITAGELKAQFVQLGGGSLAKMLVTSTSGDSMAVCFKPESKSYQQNPNTLYSSDALTLTSGCLSQGGTGLCYYCAQ